MVKFYLMQIRIEKITIDDVPEKWREAVKNMLESK